MNTNGRHNFKSLYYKFRYSKLLDCSLAQGPGPLLEEAGFRLHALLVLITSLRVFVVPTLQRSGTPELAGRSLCSRSCCGKKKGPCGAKMWQPDSSQNRVPRKTSQRCFRSHWVQTESRKLEVFKTTL